MTISALIRRMTGALHMHFIRCYMSDEAWAQHQEYIAHPAHLRYKNGKVIID